MHTREEAALGCLRYGIWDIKTLVKDGIYSIDNSLATCGWSIQTSRMCLIQRLYYGNTDVETAANAGELDIKYNFSILDIKYPPVNLIKKELWSRP